MEPPSAQLPIFYLLLLVSISSPIFIQNSLADGVTPHEAKQLRDEVLIPFSFFPNQSCSRTPLTNQNQLIPSPFRYPLSHEYSLSLFFG